MSFQNRQFPDTFVLFGVENTLTFPKKSITEEDKRLLAQLREKVVIGIVGGYDISRQVEQLGPTVLNDFDFCFSENGLIAYKLGEKLYSQSFIGWIGEEKYNELVRFILNYLAHLELPKRRGAFIKFQNGMINVSPIGHGASIEDREEFEKYDKRANIRGGFIETLKENFKDLGVKYSIGGKIEFDIFPSGWNKTFALSHVENENFKEIHFFGDKCYKGGNDYEIFTDPRTIGHQVTGPDHTMKILKELFNI